MKTFHPLQYHGNVRVFTALLVSLVILVTPVVPAASGAARYAVGFSPAATFAPAATVVTATKTDSFPDPDGDNKAEPGQTITYDVNVSNTGAADATGVNFSDTIDPNTTLVPGSLRVSPLAFADSYSATVDTAVNIPAPGVLANDTGTPAPAAQAIAAGATAQGGSVTLNADGSFNYTPPAGFQGADTFSYTATNGLSPNDTATVTINVDNGPAVTTTTPANGATAVAQNSNITVNFTEPVNATTGSFSVQCPAGSPQTFTLSASPAASFTLDPTADLPAGTTCAVTVFASQITDADSFDPPDQMAADYTFSFGVKPLAVDDMRSATGNVRIDTSVTGYSVLANDQAPGGAITAFDAASAQGGEVAVNTTTGTFTYDPPRGFTGTDSFNYTITNAAGSDTGTVVLTVTDMIWFVNNASSCSSGCDGRLSHPYTSLAAFEADNGSGGANPEAGDNVFIYTGSGSYTGPVTLENDQRVIGQGATSPLATLASVTFAPDSDAVPSTGGANPVITTTAPAANGINLAQNDSLHGLSVVNTTGTGVSGNGFGTLTVSENVVLSNTTTAGTPLSLNNGVLAATFKSISAGNNTADPDPANGIVLTNTTGSFAVEGDGADTSRGGNASGGTIQNITGGADGATAGNGIYLENAQNVALRRMQLSGFSNSAVRGLGVSGFTLQYSTISGVSGNSAGAVEGAVAFGTVVPAANGLAGGASLIDNCKISGGVEHNLEFYNHLAGSDYSLTVSNSDIKSNSAATGSDGIQIDTGGAYTGTATFSVQSCAFDDNRSQAVQAAANGSSNIVIALDNNTVQRTTQGGEGFVLSNGANGHLSAYVTNNAITGIGGATIFVGQTAGNATAASSLIGVIKGNTINHPATATNHAIIVFLTSTVGQASPANILVEGNNVTENSTSGVARAIVVDTPDISTSPSFTASVLNNTVSVGNGVTGVTPILAQARQASSGCFDIRSNVATFPNGTPAAQFGIRARRANTANMRLEQGTSASTVAATALADNNPGATTEVLGIITVVANNICQDPPTVPETSDAGPMPSQPGANQTASARVWNDIPAGRETSAADGDNGSALYGARIVRSSYERPANRRARGNASNVGDASKQAGGAAVNAARARALFSGETVNASIGTLPAGKTVHITFQVTVDDPFAGAQPQVSNQGTISGDNFTTVQTDDPAAGGSADATVTPILTPPAITIKDASVAEPASGSAPAAFAVTLSHAYTHTVTVDYDTASGGANPATAGSDYTTTSGTLTFNPGQTVQTISVPVLADADASEIAETFLVDLSGATADASIADAQAVGTITPEGTPGTVLISEVRTSGPAGPDDDFVELLNNTDSPVTVAASDASAGWALVKSGAGCGDTPVVVAVIPNGTVIPARGNYLLVGSAYSLGAYAAGDQALVFNVEDDRNVALFSTADLGNVSTGARLDAVGFGPNTGGNCDLLREGSTLAAAQGSASEHSFVRKVDKGATQDTNDNAADFIVVSTTAGAVGSNATPTLGAPGPENSTGARGPVPCNVTDTAKFGRSSLDSTAVLGSAPNTVRDATAGPNAANGTIDFRRRFTNNTGGHVTQLRFRITSMKDTSTPGAADLRALTSVPFVVTVNDPATCGGPAPCNVTVVGTTLEQPPAQGSGGGVNSTLGVGTITLATPLPSGASVNLHLLFGVQQTGDYHVSIVVETATTGSIGQDVWELRGNTESGSASEGGCNTPPVANAGADQTIECGGGTTAVTLDGSASTDADGDALTYEWREGATVLGTTATLNTSLAFGAHTITLKVTDPSGDFGEDTVSVNVVDTTDPLITAPPNVSVSTGPGAGSCGVVIDDATLGTATASDGCSASVTVTRTGVPAGNNFPVGTTIVTYTADDGHGHTKSAQQVVTVTDNTPPTVTAPANIEVNAPANSCSVSLDPGTATAEDNCPGVTVAGVRSDSQPLNAPYPVGTTTITWTANDAHGNSASGVQTVKVKDVTAPTITLTTGAINLAPPNHQYHTFSIASLVASVGDDCDAGVDINDVVISQATSDEAENANGNGDGNTVNDIVIAPDCKSLQLRAERQGGGNGRVYTITLKVKDSSGNVATAVRTVVVQQGGLGVDSGVQYAVNGCAP